MGYRIVVALVQSGKAGPLVQKLLRISKWHQQSINKVHGLHAPGAGLPPDLIALATAFPGNCTFLDPGTRGATPPSVVLALVHPHSLQLPLAGEQSSQVLLLHRNPLKSSMVISAAPKMFGKATVNYSFRKGKQPGRYGSVVEH